MSNFNKKQKLYCKYCNKECHSLNSLMNHERLCKLNPNRQESSFKYLNKDRKKFKSSTKGKICINNGKNLKYILPENLQEYLNNGWKLGVYDEFKKKMRLSSKGIASTPEKELERKRKISETMKRNPLAGGYRKGSGIGKKGWYKDIFCDSSWELAFVCYYKEHNLNIKRCKEKRKYIYENKEHIYIPDFIIDDGIIEIKGYSSKQWEAKICQNSDIKVLYYKDIENMLNYVINKYGDKFWEVLYENK